jgi:inner membrane protein
MNIPWWYWVVGGFALMLIELLGPTFFILWFGIAACLVGVVKAFVPLTLAQEFSLWGALSAILVALWFWLFPAPQRTRSGLSKEAVIGERGLITKDVTEMSHGTIRFQKPVFGSDTWTVIADVPIRSGERARIVDVIGQTLKVEPTN